VALGCRNQRMVPTATGTTAGRDVTVRR
jgi:hypothetical protein